MTYECSGNKLCGNTRDHLIVENIEEGMIHSPFDISVLKENSDPDNWKTPAFVAMWANRIGLSMPFDLLNPSTSTIHNHIQDNDGNLYISFAVDSARKVELFSSILEPGVITDPSPAGDQSLLLYYVFIVKFSQDGVPIWATYIGVDATILNPELLLDNVGNLYFCYYGFGTNTRYYNAGGITSGIINPITLAGIIVTMTESVHIAKYDTNGLVQWVQNSSTPGLARTTDANNVKFGISFNSLNDLIVTFFAGSCTIYKITVINPGTIGTRSLYTTLTSPLSPNKSLFMYSIDPNGSCKWATFVHSSVTATDPTSLFNINFDNNFIRIDPFNNIFISIAVPKFNVVSFYNANNAIPNNPVPSGSITNTGTGISADSRIIINLSYSVTGSVRWATIISFLPNSGTDRLLSNNLCDENNCYAISPLNNVSNILFFNAQPLVSGSIVNPIPSGNVPLTISRIVFIVGYNNLGITKSFTYIGRTSDPYNIKYDIEKLNNHYLYTTAVNGDYFSSSPLVGINIQPPIPAGSSILGCTIIKFNSDLVIQWGSSIKTQFNDPYYDGIVFGNLGNPFLYGSTSNNNIYIEFFSATIQGAISNAQTLDLKCFGQKPACWIAKYNDSDGKLIDGTITISDNSYIGIRKASVYEDNIYLSHSDRFDVVYPSITYYNHYSGTPEINLVNDFAGILTNSTRYISLSKHGNGFVGYPDYSSIPKYEINVPSNNIKYIYNNLKYKVLIKTNGYINNKNTKPDLLSGDPGGVITLIPNDNKWIVSSELGFKLF